MAQCPPFSDVLKSKSDEDGQAAKNAITAMGVKLCSGMDSMSVAVRLHAKQLLSDNALEAVRDFQEVKEAKNSRILENVKHSITVLGLKGFEDFLSVLGEFPLLYSVVSDLQVSYQTHLLKIQRRNQQDRLFWEQRTAQLGTPPVRSLTGPSSITQQSPPLPHSMLTVPMIEEDQRHYSACPPPHTDSRHSVTAHTPFHRMQSMPTNHFHHVGHVTNVRPQREWSKLLTLMPGPCPGTQNMSGHFPPPSCSNEVPLYSFPRPLHSNSASLYSDPGLTPLGHRGMPCSADEASANWWPVGPSNMAPDSQQPIPPQSSPQVMLHANALYFGAVSGLANEQLTSSPSPFSTGSNQHAFQPNAWQQRPWLHSRSGSGSPADSGLFSLQSSSSTVGRSVDSIVEQMGSDDAEGFLQPETPTQMCEALLSGSSCSAGGSSLEEHESSKKLHRQESFDEGNVLKQRSHPDSMDSGITGSQASLDNEDDAQPT